MSDADGDESGREDPPRLTSFAELHGCSCKVGQDDLEVLLADAGLFEDQPGLLFGVGEDAAARPIDDDRAAVSTIDAFTPVLDDPYDFGRIAACNAASDAFATGAVDDLTALVLLGLPRAVTGVAAEILAGIVDCIEGVGGVVAGGHTVLNPWPLAGCAITAVAPQEALMTASGANPGDRIYLTKPLGTQPAMGALRLRDDEFEAAVRDVAPRSIEAIGREAVRWMTTPNRDAALAARTAGSSAATDVTGFGPLGQARILADRSDVGVRLTRLPIIDGTLELSRLFGYGLEDGESAETSGGLLLSIAPERAGALEAALDEREVFAREIGRVTEGSTATLDGASVEPVALD